MSNKNSTSYFLFLVFLLFSIHVDAQDKSRKIEFPDIEGYQTLVTDLHQHSVFSDGSVWPDIRVREAIFDGVDVISLTEHLEYQPHEDDIPHKDRNRSFELAKEYAKNKDVLIVHGAEITRDMPPGHSNAIFITDANKLNVKDPMKAFEEAKNQGAFIFWNHPHWAAQYPDGVAKLTDMHRELIEKDMLHGIEVVNDKSFSDEALDIANENGLAIMGTSDIHGLIDWLYDVPNGGHRPVTLVFATAKTQEAVKEALFAGRTVAWYNNTLVGQNQYLEALIKSALTIKSAKYQELWNGTNQIAEVTIVNNSDATYILENTSEYTFYDNQYIFTVEAQKETTISVKTLKSLTDFDLSFKILNATSASKQHPEITWKVNVKQ